MEAITSPSYTGQIQGIVVVVPVIRDLNFYSFCGLVNGGGQLVAVLVDGTSVSLADILCVAYLRAQRRSYGEDVIIIQSLIGGYGSDLRLLPRPFVAGGGVGGGVLTRLPRVCGRVCEGECVDNVSYTDLTMSRIDRIEDMQVTGEHFKIPYADRFEEGEFRKRVQFMYGGRLRKVKFEYCGESIEAVLDRLPTAEILSEEDGKYVEQAEVFGKGIDMGLRSQGERVRVVE